MKRLHCTGDKTTLKLEHNWWELERGGVQTIALSLRNKIIIKIRNIEKKGTQEPDSKRPIILKYKTYQ